MKTSDPSPSPLTPRPACRLFTPESTCVMFVTPCSTGQAPVPWDCAVPPPLWVPLSLLVPSAPSSHLPEHPALPCPVPSHQPQEGSALALPWECVVLSGLWAFPGG